MQQLTDGYQMMTKVIKTYSCVIAFSMLFCKWLIYFKLNCSDLVIIECLGQYFVRPHIEWT